MQGVSQYAEFHLMALLLGAVVGAGSFGILMLPLVPVLRHGRRPSLAMGFLAIAVSCVVMTLGAAVVYLFLPATLLVFLGGVLVGLFACWIALAVSVIAGSGGFWNRDGKGKVV